MCEDIRGQMKQPALQHSTILKTLAKNQATLSEVKYNVDTGGCHQMKQPAPQPSSVNHITHPDTVCQE
jgi:hypothetical protein